MRAIVVTVAALTLLMLVATSARGATTSPACWVACHYRHPVARWKLDHHLARCETAHCREKRERTGSVSSRTGSVKQAYPCVVRWTYDAVRWWHLRYGIRGPYGRNHVGYGPTSYRRCL